MVDDGSTDTAHPGGADLSRLDHRLVPYVHVVVALVGQVVIFVGSSFYLREGAAINPVLLDAPVIATLADPTIVNMEFICSVIALPLLFDLLLDIATYFWALFKGRTAAAAAASDRLNEDDTASLNSQMTRPMLPLLEVAVEWVMRLMYLVAFVVPNLSLIVSPDDAYRPVLFLMTSHMKLFVLACMAMVSMTDTIDRTLFELVRSFLFSLLFTLSQIAMFFCAVGDQTRAVAGVYIFAKVLACVMSGYYCMLMLYHSFLIMQKGAWGRRLHNISTKELCFVIYSMTLTMGSVTICSILAQHEFDGYKVTSTDLLVHDITMIFYAVIATSLPVRVARMEGGRAQGMIITAKRNVSHTLNAPLRVVLSELDGILDDETVMNTMSRDALQRLVRIACACDTAVEVLRRVAVMQEGEGLDGERDRLHHSGGGSSSDDDPAPPHGGVVVRAMGVESKSDDTPVGGGCAGLGELTLDLHGLDGGASDHGHGAASVGPSGNGSVSASTHTAARTLRSAVLSSISEETGICLNGTHHFLNKLASAVRPGDRSVLERNKLVAAGVEPPPAPGGGRVRGALSMPRARVATTPGSGYGLGPVDEVQGARLRAALTATATATASGPTPTTPAQPPPSPPPSPPGGRSSHRPGGVPPLPLHAVAEEDQSGAGAGAGGGSVSEPYSETHLQQHHQLYCGDPDGHSLSPSWDATATAAATAGAAATHAAAAPAAAGADAASSAGGHRDVQFL